VLNGSQYLQSLDDNRQTFFEGEAVKNIAEHPVLGQSGRNVADTYDRFYDPAEGARSPVMVAARSVEELRERIPLLRSCDIVTRTTFGSLMALLTAADRLSAAGWNPDPGEVWIVGDTPRDLACARAVGVRCALVATGRVPIGELAALGADIVLPDLSDPRPLLDRWRL